MLTIGSVVKSKVHILGNEIGTFGVIYEEYNLGDGHGVSIIFENGNYDGFSEDEQDTYVEEIGFNSKCSNYKFSDVMKVSQDFKIGKFDSALKDKKFN